MIGTWSVYIIVFIVAIVMLFQYLTKDDNEYHRVDTPARDQVDQISGSSTSQVERTEYRAGDKED